MARTVAVQFAEIPAAAVGERIYGVVGGSLNRLTDAFRRQAKIGWAHIRHEEAGASASGAGTDLKAVLNGRGDELVDLAVTNLWR